jgi:hypothetical protein
VAAQQGIEIHVLLLHAVGGSPSCLSAAAAYTCRANDAFDMRAERGTASRRSGEGVENR